MVYLIADRPTASPDTTVSINVTKWHKLAWLQFCKHFTTHFSVFLSLSSTMTLVGGVVVERLDKPSAYVEVRAKNRVPLLLHWFAANSIYSQTKNSKTSQ